LPDLLVLLLDLYSKALSLPQAKAETNRVITLEINVPTINFGHYDRYWKVFNPYQFDEPVSAGLADDILNIYIDVKRGIIIREKRTFGSSMGMEI
jgi:hypothetical protein